jgi:hypothetical protein
MALTAAYFDKPDGVGQSQFEYDLGQGAALLRQFQRWGEQATMTLEDGTGLTAAQRTALRAFYGVASTGLRAQIQAWAQSLPTP